MQTKTLLLVGGGAALLYLLKRQGEAARDADFAAKTKGQPTGSADGKGLSLSDFDPTTDSKYGKWIGKGLELILGEPKKVADPKPYSDMGGKGVLALTDVEKKAADAPWSPNFDLFS